MSNYEKTVKCPICGEPYKVYAFYDGDQSACPQCRRKAEDKEPKKVYPFMRQYRKAMSK